jgi:DNA-binding XRE family transcriptional regulator
VAETRAEEAASAVILGVPYSLIDMDPRVRDALEALGLAVKHARGQAGMSQDGLERSSGVDQSSISRFERGLAPSFSAVKLVQLSLGMRGAFPLGVCPHDHTCRWHLRMTSDSATMSDLF